MKGNRMNQSKRIKTGISILTGIIVAGAFVGLILLAIAIHT